MKHRVGIGNGTFLRPTPRYTQTDNNLRPQATVAYSPDAYQVIIDNSQVEYTNPYSISTANGPEIFTAGVSHIRIGDFQMSYYVPNVNDRNNQFSFFSSVSGVTHTVTLPTEHYISLNTFLTDLVAELNTVTGASGLTFSFVINGDGVTGAISSAGGTFYWVDDDFSQKTKGLYAPQIDTILAGNKPFGPAHLKYTRFFTVNSNELTAFAHAKCTSNLPNFSDNILAVIYTPEPDVYEMLVSGPFYTQFSYFKDKLMSNVDIRLVDEYGETLPVYGQDNRFTLILEIII